MQSVPTASVSRSYHTLQLARADEGRQSSKEGPYTAIDGDDGGDGDGGGDGSGDDGDGDGDGDGGGDGDGDGVPAARTPPPPDTPDTEVPTATAPPPPDTDAPGRQGPITAGDVGSPVVVFGYAARGTLRFFGQHAVEGTPRCGIEFDKPVGKNDGTVKGHTYFECRAGHGVLVKPPKVTRLLVPK